MAGAFWLLPCSTKARKSCFARYQGPARGAGRLLILRSVLDTRESLFRFHWRSGGTAVAGARALESTRSARAASPVSPQARPIIPLSHHPTIPPGPAVRLMHGRGGAIACPGWPHCGRTARQHPLGMPCSGRGPVAAAGMHSWTTIYHMRQDPEASPPPTNGRTRTACMPQLRVQYLSAIVGEMLGKLVAGQCSRFSLRAGASLAGNSQPTSCSA